MLSHHSKKKSRKADADPMSTSLKAQTVPSSVATAAQTHVRYYVLALILLATAINAQRVMCSINCHKHAIG